MKEKELEKLKKKILEKREKIIKFLERAEKSGMSWAESGERIFHHHLSDTATDEELKEIAFMNATRLREELALIEDAISRIKEGTYGICLKCLKPISIERLKAIPYARYCIKCQIEIEKRI
ncbi:MAG: TraR/DksA family transcriptional regulator [Candidatus Hydrothermales bacterium]